jgi:ERCC4-type nuclease
MVNVVAPFTVVVDTREQLGYEFADLTTDARQGRRPLEVPTVRGTLDSGDYSIAGLENQIAIERKSAEDLFNTLGQGRERFSRELARLNQLEAAFVICESEWSDLLATPPQRSKMSPKCVIRSIMAWQMKFNRVHWWMMPGRRSAEALAFRLLEKFYLYKMSGANHGGVRPGAARRGLAGRGPAG